MRITLIIIALIFTTLAQANAPVANGIVAFPDRKDPKNTWGKRVPFPAVFPTSFANDPSIKYAYTKSISTTHFDLFLSNMENCRGEKECTIVVISAGLGEYPQIYYSATFAELTKRIKLSESIIGYYTPNYTFSNNTSSRIEFRCQNVLYSASWHIKPKEDMQGYLIKLARDMMATLPECNYHQ